MFTLHIDLAAARKRLANVVSRFGADHSPQSSAGTASCIYATVRDGALVPVCIVGQFVNDLGLLGILVQGAPDLHQPVQYGACSVGSGLWEDLATVGITFDEDAKSYLRYAQEAQDSGVRWGQALDYADEAVEADAVRALRKRLGVNKRVTFPAVHNFHPDQQPSQDTNEELDEWEKELLAGN